MIEYKETSVEPTIRSATPDDLPSILAIYNEAVLTTTASYDLEPASLEDRAAWYAQRTAAGLPVFVADLGGTVAGFSSFGPFRPKPGYRHTVEHTVYVGSAWRGRGLGRLLMLPLIERARAMGHHVMIGVIDAENEGSRRFHEALGFFEAGRLRQVGHKFGRWLDLILMQLMLEETANQEPPATVVVASGS